MRGDVPKYELVAKPSLAEVLALLDAQPGAYKPLAGGTDVMVMLATGKLAHTRWVSLWNLPELRGIEVTEEAVTFGALTTYTEVQEDAVCRAEFPMLCQAGFETGGVAIQNRGTLGGNIANASPAADSPPALLAYGASLEIVSAKGARWIDYDGFHTGYKKMNLAPTELVSRIRLPRSKAQRVHFYRKVGPRRAQAISKVCFAACAELDGAKVASVKIALGGVAPIIPRCKETEAALTGAVDLARAKAALAKEIAPIDDVRSNARYRRKVAENLLVDFATQLRHRVGLDQKAR
jgi:CO/xanthine dehydrogenase FAD-binding subunit